MKKELYWHIESNGDMSKIIKDLGDLKVIIEIDFKNETEEDEILFLDMLQYTITPIMLTISEFKNLHTKSRTQ
jgi:hypothetical protein